MTVHFWLFDDMRLSQTMARADRGLMRPSASQNKPATVGGFGVAGVAVVSCLLCPPARAHYFALLRYCFSVSRTKSAADTPSA